MPFVLQHSKTGRIFSCMLTNKYDLEYYGIKSWLSEEEARRYPEFLTSQGVFDADLWQVVEVSENQLKLFQVKLNNNPANRLYLRQGTAVVEKQQ